MPAAVRRVTVFTARLVVRRNGRTLKAGFLPAFLRARIEPAAGTIRGLPYDGGASQRPAGVAVERVSIAGDRVTAEISAADSLAEHLAAIVLIDEDTGRALPINYRTALAAEADSQGNLARVVLTVPENPPIEPGRTRAVVIAYLYPVASTLLE